ncbi:MAG TPA: cytochrome c oxidase assembly factor Coa1 family protein [Pyrinomonadaceae bacterium]|jgi:TonB family protein|nr:cytochrome c oxidase assembly factor Coa1 family protein [Pyrinomonadaceae bacterium]
MMNPNQAQFGGSFQQPAQPQQKGCLGRNWKWMLPVGCLGLILAGVAVIGGIFLVAMSAMKSSDVYKGALDRARSNPEAVAALGEPIKDGWLVQGNVNFSGGSGTANLQIPVSGPKKSGTIQARAVYEGDAWMYERLDLIVEGGGTISLLDRAAGTNGLGSPPGVEGDTDATEDPDDAVTDDEDETDSTTSSGVKTISGGVLNGKAVSKPEPPYPSLAKAARASGTVTVQVTVDESGKVVAAKAVSGHPLLQSAAVAAARQATFKPTLLSGQPVRVTGVLTYNFVLP